MSIKNEIKALANHFGIEGELIDFSVYTDGHINSTYRVTFESGDRIDKYIVQGINTHVFKNPDQLMENVVNVTKYLKEKIDESGKDSSRQCLEFLQAETGKYYFCRDDKCWRIYRFIDKSYTINYIKNRSFFESAGKAFGRFQRNLSGYPMESLHETIKDFHNTPKRVEALEVSVAADVKGRAKDVEQEIKFALDRKKDAEVLINLYEEGLIPLRVTHNDTKLNNVLFDEETNKAICVIDLDTIMPGFSLYDFGDAIRFGGNTTKEDDADLDNVNISIELFKSYTRGFLSTCAKALTKAEVDHLAFSAKLMTYECGVRFLTDYLDGDVYFRTEYPEHNLVRARNQFKLVEEIENNLDKMNSIVEKIYLEAIK
ncbi:MAG: aminoglycoside phosphotransferase family protein [Ruminococcaceae bacterium]|nr:aminoglycoside phosphotransferase family protein [Oscillospiraceae bacterium]